MRGLTAEHAIYGWADTAPLLERDRPRGKYTVSTIPLIVGAGAASVWLAVGDAAPGGSTHGARQAGAGNGLA